CRTDMALSSASVYVIASERPGLCSSLRDNNGVFELFFFTDPATTEIYTLSLHDALPIYGPSGTVAPYSSLLRRIPGTMARGIRKMPSSSSSQARVWRFMSSVREAFVASVTCTPPAGPPVSHQITHESIVPKQTSPRSACARTPGT